MAPTHRRADDPLTSTTYDADRNQYRTFKKVNGVVRQHRWPKGTKPSRRQVDDWLSEQRVLGRLVAEGRLVLPATDSETFRDDVRLRYLPAVRVMPTYRWRRDDLELWVAVFGDQPRTAITRVLIAAQLNRWRKTYAASTCNHRRTALMHVWSVLDGKSAPNPVKDVPRFRDDSMHRPPRHLSPAAVRALFTTMRPSPTKARLQLMAWAGWPQVVIMRLVSSDIDWTQRLVLLNRSKGKGTRPKWVPLFARGLAALRIFARCHAWGAFSTSSLRKALRSAALRVQANATLPASVRAEVDDITPYDLRHSFLTLAAATTGDDRTVAVLGLLSDVRMVPRYTKAATDPRVLATLGAMHRALKTSRKNSRKTA